MNDQSSDPRIAQAAEAIRSADALLIGAGAGLSAAAGYDFTSEERFARDYPGMLQWLHAKTQMMANFSVGETFSGAITFRMWPKNDLMQVSHTLFIRRR